MNSRIFVICLFVAASMMQTLQNLLTRVKFCWSLSDRNEKILLYNSGGKGNPVWGGGAYYLFPVPEKIYEKIAFAFCRKHISFLFCFLCIPIPKALLDYLRRVYLNFIPKMRIVWKIKYLWSAKIDPAMYSNAKLRHLKASKPSPLGTVKK